MKNQRWWWLGALGIATLLFAGCGSSDTTEGAGVGLDADDALNPDSGPDAAAEDAEPSESEDVADGAVAAKDPTTPVAVDAVYQPDADPLLASFEPFEPGTYRTGALGTPMSFTATEALNTQPNGDGQFVLSDISSRAPDDRDLVFLRVGAFSDPAAPNTAIEEQAPWPSDDFRGWLDNLDDGIIASEAVEMTVNGLPAIRVDLELRDDMECGWLPGFCVGFIQNNGHDIRALNKDASYRVWIVEQGSEDPLAIVAGIGRDEDASWFERADVVMDTIGFGEIEPNPVQWLVAGPNSLDVLGGVEVSLPADVAELTNDRSRLVRRWTGRLFSFIPITESPAAIYFSEKPHDMDGTPLESSDEVVGLLTAAGAELTELDATTVGGIEARVFDVTSSDVGAILLRFSPLDTAQPFYGWDAPAAGRIWLLDHPQQGLVMISTHAFEDVDEMLPQVNALGEAIVRSMTFAP